MTPNEALREIAESRVRNLQLQVASIGGEVLFAESERAILSTFANVAATDPSRLADVKLAAEIASGRLKKTPAIYTLVRLLAQKANKIRRGCRGQNVGSVSYLPGVSQEAFDDVGFQLSQVCANKEGMSTFGYQSRCAPSINFDMPMVPNSFMSIEDPQITQLQVVTSTQRLECRGTRNCLLVFDETNFIPGFLTP